MKGFRMIGQCFSLWMMSFFILVTFSGCQTLPTDAPTGIPYGNADLLEGTGADLQTEAFSMQTHSAEKESATEISSQDLIQSLRENGLEEKAYLVQTTVTLSNLADCEYDGNGAVIFLEQGLQMAHCERVTLRNLVLIGSVHLTDSRNIVWNRIDFSSDHRSSLTTDTDCSDIVLKDCRITCQNGTALFNQANCLTVLDSVISYQSVGLEDVSDAGLTIRNCLLTGEGNAVMSTGRDVAVRGNTIETGENATGVILHGENVYDVETGTICREVEDNPTRYVLHNGLIAENRIINAQCGIFLDGVTNSTVVWNSVTSIQVNNGHAVYVCDNELGAVLTATHVEYLLADGNQYPDDGYPHDAVTVDLYAPSGNNLLDVDARLEYGVDETLLPQVDRELFVAASCKTTVRDMTIAETNRTVDAYVMELAGQEGGKRVILPPGKYTIQDPIDFNGNLYDETTIYGYGVYLEKSAGLDTHMKISSVNNLQVKGVTFAFAQQSCGQVYVLKKLGGNRVLVVTGAGMINEFGNTDPAYFNTTSIGIQRKGTFFACCDASFSSIIHSDDLEPGTMRVTLGGELYKQVRIGDILTCRAAGDNTPTVSIWNSADVQFIDVTMYGNSACFAFYESENRTATTYYRVLNTSRTGEVIQESLYQSYRELEKRYTQPETYQTVDLEISIDELGRFRGAPAHIGSMDATHTNACAEGSQAISCLFENMDDDGTNQKSTHARLHDYKVDETNQTVTLTYKGNLSEAAWKQFGVENPTYLCHDFRVGDRIYIYTSSGQLVYDGIALTASEYIGSGSGEVGLKNGGMQTGVYPLYQLTAALWEEIDGEKVLCFHEDALQNLGANGSTGTYAEYLAKDNRWESDYKVLVDNRSMASGGFLFDNTMVRNIRSRGLLIKASGGTIQNCTFQNIGMSAIAVNYEIYWGESGIVENLNIENNLFIHTGYFGEDESLSVISVNGLSSSGKENTLLYQNIRIDHNRFVHRATEYCIYLRGIKNVTITENEIGIHGEEDRRMRAGYGVTPVICMKGAANIELQDNTYELFEKEYCEPDVYQLLVKENTENIYGRDLETR